MPDTRPGFNQSALGANSIQESEEDGYMSSNFGDETDDGEDEDLIFGKVKAAVVSRAHEDRLVRGEGSVASLDRLSTHDSSASPHHHSLTYGFIPKGCYSHPIKSGAILGGKI